ncbi:MAG: SoxR reducing system RseC family protein [Xanthomonadales bacterium]|nr:SoxR reducing system RseC family protein [Xanthomonadales bacterium]
MIAQQGRVLAVQGGDALVRIGGTSGCPACDAGKGCGAGIFGRLLNRNPVSVKVRNSIGAAVGQPVQLGIAEHRFLALVARIYVLPLLAGLSGAAIGFAVAQRLGYPGPVTDLLTGLCGVMLAGLAFYLARRSLRRIPGRAAIRLLPAAPAQRCEATETDRTGPEPGQ